MDRFRPAVVAALWCLLAGAGLLAAPPAAAAQINGAPVETQTQFCSSSSLSLRTDLVVTSPGVQPQAGQDFQLVLTAVGLNQCLASQSVGLNIGLPSGVTVSPTGQSRCLTFAASNPGATSQVPCVRSDAGGGFQRIDPQNADAWALTNGAAVQVQLAVRASGAGQRTASAHVCDSGSSVICTGSPVANAIPTVTFGVAAAPAPPPPATISADKLKIMKNGTACGGGGNCPDLSTTSTSIKVLAYLIGQRPAGSWRIQRRGPAAASFTTIATRDVTAGSGSLNFPTTATGLQPATTYRFRACFTPTGAAQVCGTEIQLATKAA